MTSPVRNLEVIPSTDDAAWMQVLSESVQYDFHHLAGYHRVAQQQGEGIGYLFVYRAAGVTIGIPLLLRPVDEADPAGYLDATSVYGYGGPVASHPELPASVIRSFHSAIEQELRRRGVVSAFSRLHPLISQSDILESLGEIRPIGLTVSVDLRIGLDEQWAGYSKGCRRIVRRAREAGVTCVHDREQRYWSQWAAMYGDTMRRVNAPSLYHFDESYFEVLARELGDVLHLFVALYEGEPIAAGLFTQCNGIVQAHLAALRREYLHLSPARLIDDTARIWAYETGAHTFHLGGGVAGRDDSLLQYKAGFSDRRHHYAVWQWVVDAGAYEDLERRWQGRSLILDPAAESEQFFPAYRRPLSG